MTVDQAIQLFEQTMETALIVGTPVILLTFIVGLLISIFQAATQIQEMTLTFIPKIVVTILALIFFGSWMFRTIIDFIRELMVNILTIIQ